MGSRRLALLVLVLALPGAARAWTLLGTSWAWQDHPIEDPFLLDLAGFPSTVGVPEDVELAVRRTLDAWSATGDDLALPYGGTMEGAVREGDASLEIRYLEWEDSPALAYASVWAWEDGAMYDCDVTVLGSGQYGAIAWSADPDGAPSGTVDLEATLLHEFGHCAGIGHSETTAAVMYAYYQGYRALQPDDLAAVDALYGEPCVDGDGDGYTDCDLDCDDADASVHPGAPEACDGVDQGCDGLVDADEEVSLLFGEGSAIDSSEWISLGNAFRVDAPTRLVQVRQRLSVAAGTRLAWTVYAADDEAGPWTLVRSERTEATSDSWQDSPRFDLPLEAGRVYAFSLGALSSSVRAGYDSSPPLDPQGPLTPLGYVWGRALGDQNEEVNPDFLASQEVTVLDLADADGDGVTVLCGDCAPEDPAAHLGAEEVCDGVDNDCDDAVDEDFQADADGDGAIDCLDPCPSDPADDRDGDGACDSDDPCPDDPDDACDDVDSAAPEDSAGDGGDGDTPCGCGGGPIPAGAGWLAVLALALARRRAG